MTVCAAAICEYNRVIGVSDRMITTGDIEFEPPQTKVFHLSSSLCVMTAGDTTLQTEIMRDVEIAVAERVVSEPSNWWRVRDVAELYRGYYEEVRLSRAESAILAPLGLDRDSFMTEQASMEPSLVRSLVNELTDYALHGVQALFVGTDNDGPVLLKTGSPGVYPHIYVSHGGTVACYDSIGFAAIGIGDWHAQSQFMFAKYTRGRPLAEALFLAYSAKKHAEVAPGVGKETDMFSIGPGLGSHISIGDHVMAELERTYQESRQGINQATTRAEQSFGTFIAEIMKPEPPKSQEPATESSPPRSTDDAKSPTES